MTMETNGELKGILKWLESLEFANSASDQISCFSVITSQFRLSHKTILINTLLQPSTHATLVNGFFGFFSPLLRLTPLHLFILLIFFILIIFLRR